MAKHDLTAQRLRELLQYDPNTGLFTRLVTRGRSATGSIAGTAKPRGFVVIEIDNRNHRAHRLAWLYVHGVWPTNEIDHINGDCSDNRFCNLRDVPHYVNSQNIRAAYKDKKHAAPLGAYKHPSSPNWSAMIRVNGELIRLGCFPTAEEAHAAYVEAKRRLHVGCTL